MCSRAMWIRFDLRSRTCLLGVAIGTCARMSLEECDQHQYSVQYYLTVSTAMTIAAKLL